MPMNKIAKIILLTLCTSVVTVTYGHGKKQHEENSSALEYDAVTTEFGSYDPSLTADRTIEVNMNDNMRFTPDTIQVTAGETIKFVVSNHGMLQHEFVLGTADSLKDHAALMIKFPNMELEEPYMAHVDPGKTMEILWQFSESGVFAFGCLLPGHYDAGMKGAVSVVD